MPRAPPPARSTASSWRTAGPGYTAPVIGFTGGGGSGAAASATLSTGVVTSIAVTTPGAGYTAPSVTIDAPTTGTQATATASGALDTVTVTQGSGYAPGETPVVTISSPPASGSQALATALADGSGNIAVTVTNPGGGYTSAPTVTIADPAGGGTAATATATMTVTAIKLVIAGAGYTAVPSVAVNDSGSPTTPAEAAATISPLGAITAIHVTTPGTGYTSAPAVGITDADGTGASATSTIGVTAITMTAVGSGYTTAPTVTVNDSGTPATSVVATANVLSNVVASVTVGTPGAGYTTPTVVFSGGGGTGASATATVVTDVVSAVNVTAAGTGYSAGSGGIKKFVDTLPGLGRSGVNDLGQYIPVAVADTTTYPGSDYYEIALVQYREQLSSSLPPVVNTGGGAIPTTSKGGTLLRAYVQIETPANASVSNHYPLYNTLVDGTTIPITKNGQQVYAVDAPHYLGPFIIAKGGTTAQAVPVRVKFTNYLPTGSGGDLFIPVDTSDMGAGMGPLTAAGAPCDPTTTTCASYTQNRASVHLHGGATPWISDGTPYQWITPAGETTPYPKGVSVQNVPDMPDPGDGSMTFFYTNQQSARLMFYHDHAVGITRLDVYAGEAAGYLVTDPAEQAAVASGAIPSDQIPLVIQDKTFVPNAAQLLAQDPTWDTAKYGGEGSLWFPHVYMPNQNPADDSGADAMGRWDYALWFWPPYNGLLAHEDLPNPLCATDPTGLSCTTMPTVPGIPNPSLVPESYMDTPVINGTAYPVLDIQPQAYRFRILNAANDRSWNLSLYQAAANGNVWNPDGTLANANAGEVPMVPAQPDPSIPFPTDWTTASDGVPGTRPDILDGRAGGVPDPRYMGPSWVQLGSEGGVLPAVTTIDPEPVGYQYNLRNIVVTNVTKHSLLLGPAERADVVVDFSQYAGKTLILYNDSGAPVPAWDPRNDYYTGDPDYTSMGGAPTTLPGYGPNTRTVMQIHVAAATPAPAFDTTALNTAVQSLFATTQPAPIVPEVAYGAASNTYVRIQDTSVNFTPTNPAGPNTTVPLQPKAIQELFELNYGRMNATLGVELPFTNGNNQTTVPLGYAEPTTEIMSPSDVGTPVGSLGDGTQIWKITHNGVDTHAIHFHLFNVQLINRVGWDGAIRAPDANELGWKETVRMNPLEDAIVALRPVTPELPFGVPDSIRPINPSMPLGMVFPTIDPITGNPSTFVNDVVNFGWEYVWHCHLLGHEENDMMRPMEFDAAKALAAAPVLSRTGTGNISGPVNLTWTDGTPNGLPLGSPAGEIGFRIERAPVTAGVVGTFAKIGTTLANKTTFSDATAVVDGSYAYRVIAFNAAGDSTSNSVQIVANVHPQRHREDDHRDGAARVDRHLRRHHVRLRRLVHRERERGLQLHPPAGQLQAARRPDRARLPRLLVRRHGRVDRDDRQPHRQHDPEHRGERQLHPQRAP